jgi:hypothetical protein
LALPTCHSKKSSKIKVERMKNGILIYTAENKKISAWNATAYNERFGAMAAVSRRNGSENLEDTAPHERQWKPPLRQAAWTL